MFLFFFDKGELHFRAFDNLQTSSPSLPDQHQLKNLAVLTSNFSPISVVTFLDLYKIKPKKKGKNVGRHFTHTHTHTHTHIFTRVLLVQYGYSILYISCSRMIVFVAYIIA